MVGTDESTGERVKLVWKEEPGKKKSENTESNFQEKKGGGRFYLEPSTLV